MKINTSRLRDMAMLWVVSFTVLMLVLTGVPPDQAGPEGITLVFGLLYVFLTVSIQCAALLVGRFSFTNRAWRYEYSILWALLPVTLIALQSLGQLIARDVMIFISIVILAVFYLSKSR